MKNLTQYKNASPEELEVAAIKKLEEKKLEGELSSQVNPEELDIAKTIYNQYTAEYEIESSSDRRTLYDLIYLEITNLRIKKYLNDNQTASDGGSSIIHNNTLDTLRSNNDQIAKLKALLGMTKQEEDKELADYVKIHNNIMQRFHAYVNDAENRANFDFQCPHCLEFSLIRRRIDKEKDEIVKHPWYIAGGFLFNKEIFSDLSNRIITPAQACRYLNITMDLLEWMLKSFKIEIHNPEL